MKNKEVEGLFTLDEMYILHASLRHLGSSMDHLLSNILQKDEEISLMTNMENLAAKIHRIINLLENKTDVYN